MHTAAVCYLAPRSPTCVTYSCQIDNEGLLAEAHSPVELKVYDSQGRVTGVVNGEEKNEIPYSTCCENTVAIFSSYDLYTYEVAGTDEGSYGLTVTRVAEQTSNFALTNVATSANAVHEYAIDWETLSQGGQGVTMKIDSDGDGTFEKVIRLPAMEEETGRSYWPWMIAGLVIILITILVIGSRIADGKGDARA